MQVMAVPALEPGRVLFQARRRCWCWPREGSTSWRCRWLASHIVVILLSQLASPIIVFLTYRYDCEFPLDKFTPVFRGRVISQVGPVLPSEIQQIGFMLADKNPGRFELEIRQIDFLGAGPIKGSEPFIGKTNKGLWPLSFLDILPQHTINQYPCLRCNKVNNSRQIHVTNIWISPGWDVVSRKWI